MAPPKSPDNRGPKKKKKPAKKQLGRNQTRAIRESTVGFSKPQFKTKGLTGEVRIKFDSFLLSIKRLFGC